MSIKKLNISTFWIALNNFNIVGWKSIIPIYIPFNLSGFVFNLCLVWTCNLVLLFFLFCDAAFPAHCRKIFIEFWEIWTHIHHLRTTPPILTMKNIRRMVDFQKSEEQEFKRELYREALRRRNCFIIPRMTSITGRG